MAVPTPKAWGLGGGAWADDVASEEAQTGAPLAAPVNAAAFPSLSDALQQLPAGKSKKVKGKTMSLAEFSSAPAPFRSHGPPKVSDKEILAKLPTSSRGKPEGEENAADTLGGGFKDYGGDRGDRGGFAVRGGDGPEGRSERSGFGFESSKADEEDVWSKQFKPSLPSERRGFGGAGGGFGDRERNDAADDGAERGPSAADTSNNWGAERKFEPTAPAARAGGAFGGDRERSGFGSAREYSDRPGLPLTSKADEEDQWGRSRAFQPSATDAGLRTSGDRKGFGFSGEASSRSEEDDRWARRGPPGEPSSSSLAPAGGRPRLALAPRTKPIEPIVVQKEEVTAAPVTEPEIPVPAGPPKPKINPFGHARPVELKEKASQG